MMYFSKQRGCVLEHEVKSVIIQNIHMSSRRLSRMKPSTIKKINKENPESLRLFLTIFNIAYSTA